MALLKNRLKLVGCCYLVIYLRDIYFSSLLLPNIMKLAGVPTMEVANTVHNPFSFAYLKVHPETSQTRSVVLLAIFKWWRGNKTV